jgi:arabinofuranosyltransferase
MVFAHAWISEDAYITFRCVENFLSGYGPVYNPGERVQVFTHPLWFFLLSIGGLLGNLYYIAIFLGLIFSFGSIYLIAKLLISRFQAGWAAIIGVAILFTSLSFLEFQTSGLENSLTNFLLAAMIYIIFNPEYGVSYSSGQLSLMVLLGSLVLLTRIDFLFLLSPLLVSLLYYSLWQREESISLKRYLVSGLPLIVWLLFATIYYGTPLPNTAYAKLGAFPLNESAKQGIIYLADFAMSEPLHFVASATLLYVAIISFQQTLPRGLMKRTLSLALSIGIIFHVIYVIIIGGDFMRGRFFTPVIFLSVILGAIGLQSIFSQPSPWIPLAVVILFVTTFCLTRSDIENNQVYPTGITREMTHYQNMWLSRRIRQPIRDGMAEPLRRYTEFYGPIAVKYPKIGLFGYVAGPKVLVIDPFGLSDAFIARAEPIPESRIGHIDHNVPLEYYQLRADISQLPNWVDRVNKLDPSLREEALARAKRVEWTDPIAERLYNDMQTLVAAPVISIKRLKVIARYLFSKPAWRKPRIFRTATESVKVQANYHPRFGHFQQVLAKNTSPDGTPWNDPTHAVSLNDIESWITFDFGKEIEIGGIALQADNNDVYLVTFSRKGKKFGYPWVVPKANGPGLQTRTTPPDFFRIARFIRVQPKYGDGFYSLSRIKIFPH